MTAKPLPGTDPLSPDSLYTWIFLADSGDSWGGTLVADTGLLAVGQTIAWPAGTYTILSADPRGVDLSSIGIEDGQVFVEWYSDREAGFLPTRAGPAVATGSAGLGSELDAAWTGQAWAPFGLGGAEQADGTVPSADTCFSWVFEGWSGDRWEGQLFATGADFAKGDIIPAVGGRYRIVGEAALTAGVDIANGKVRLTGAYFDAASGTHFSIRGEDGATDHGTAGLGSEIGEALTADGARAFGQAGAIRAADARHDLHLFGVTFGAFGHASIVQDVDGGVDTLAVPFDIGGSRLDLNPGALSQTPAGAFFIDPTTWIENVSGTEGHDVLIGNRLSNLFFGRAGNDFIDGGEGWDTLVLANGRNDYLVLAWGGQVVSIPRTEAGWRSDGLDYAVNVEAVMFAGSYEAISTSVPNIRPLEYIASHADLMNAFGINEHAGFNHLAFIGAPLEGRRITFNALEYAASHPDLMAAFGVDANASAQHFISAGRFEGRMVSFNALEYIASHPDLMAAIGANMDVGAVHYIMLGRYEGRSSSFDGQRYLASQPDLLALYGNDTANAVSHYITTGRAEGRRATFEGLEYIASYTDLMNAFGTNARQGITHYISSGFPEGRHVKFNDLEYIASYSDLMASFGIHGTLGSNHYINFGRFEGRFANFDSLEYIASYADLMSAYGVNGDLGAIHYILMGHAEGRLTTFDGQAYLNKYSDIAAAFGNDISAAVSHYILAGRFEGRSASAEIADILC